jgi:O-antigen/teichoic acid export membrane protein
LKGLDQLLVWGRAALLTGGAQGGIQLLGFAAGIVAIRSLAPDQFAFYTIATTALGGMAALTDSGLSSSVMANGGKVWADRAQLGIVVATGLRLRLQLALFALPLALPLIVLLLHRQGAGWTDALLIVTAVALLFLASLNGQLLEVVPRLHPDLLPLQRIQVGAAIGRLALAALALPWLPLAAVATVCAAGPQWWSNWRLRRLANMRADLRMPSDPATRTRLLKQVTRTMPGVFYYAISGQLSIWLVSVFGHSGDVATVGALGRLAMILALVGSVLTLVAVPRFARIPAHEHLLVQRRFWQLQACCLAACLVPISALAAFPEPALAVLGKHYSGLGTEAVLMAASSAMSTQGGLAYVLGNTRGIVAPPLLLLPYGIAGQVALILLLPVDTVSGVIWIGLLSQASQWLLHTVYFVWKSHRHTDLTSRR